MSVARTASHKARLGHALRTIRSRLSLTLAEASARTGVAVSTLSKVENGQMSLTYDKLVQLSEGLEIDISTFFDPIPTNGEERRPAADRPPQHHAPRRGPAGRDP